MAKESPQKSCSFQTRARFGLGFSPNFGSKGSFLDPELFEKIFENFKQNNFFWKKSWFRLRKFKTKPKHFSLQKALDLCQRDSQIFLSLHAFGENYRKIYCSFWVLHSGQFNFNPSRRKKQISFEIGLIINAWRATQRSKEKVTPIRTLKSSNTGQICVLRYFWIVSSMYVIQHIPFALK